MNPILTAKLAIWLKTLDNYTMQKLNIQRQMSFGEFIMFREACLDTWINEALQYLNIINIKKMCGKNENISPVHFYDSVKSHSNLL